jgi:SnoaL-like domain
MFLQPFLGLFGLRPLARLRQQREVVAAFLAALHSGDFEGIVALLDPDVVVHIDPAAGRPGTPTEIHGAAEWAKGAITFAQGVSQAGRFVKPMLVNGRVGIVWAPGGKLSRALRFPFANGKIAEVDIIAAPARLDKLDLAILSLWGGRKGCFSLRLL